MRKVKLVQPERRRGRSKVFLGAGAVSLAFLVWRPWQTGAGAASEEPEATGGLRGANAEERAAEVALEADIATSRQIAGKWLESYRARAADFSEQDYQGLLNEGQQHRELTPEQEERAREVSKHFNTRAPTVLARMLAEQPSDPEWQRAIETGGEHFLVAAGYRGTAIEKVDCRQTLCHAVFSHRDDEEAQRFRNDGVDTGPWYGDQYGSGMELPGGKIGTYVYFARTGDHDAFLQVARGVLNKRYYM